MQWGYIQKALRAAHKENPENIRALHIARRIGKFRSRRSKARIKVANSNTHIEIREKLFNFDLLTRALEENWKIVSLDAEWTQRKVITEIGVTIYHNGKIDAHNICVGPGGKGFLHGITRYMQDGQAHSWLDDVFADARLIIGHSFKNDVRQMHHWRYSMPQLPIVDTANWSKIIFPPHEISLSKLAKKYDIECQGAHCGGNDALMTLKVALKMREQILLVFDEPA